MSQVVIITSTEKLFL